ncbi:MAG: phage tail tip lysozyme, partial [Candidatus Saccharimonas aalborgensis]
MLFRAGVWLRTLFLSLLITVSGVPVSALSEADYSTNNIFIYQKGGNASCSSSGSGSQVSGNSNVAKMWNYFISKGLNDQQAAGILGNIQEESGFSPFRQEGTYINDFTKGGYGIVQWTGPRRTAIVDALTSKYPDIMAKYFNKQYGGATSKANGYVPEGISVE